MPPSPDFLQALTVVPGVRAGWVERVPNLPMEVDKSAALRLLMPFHQRAVEEFGGGTNAVWHAEQVHGNRVEVVPIATTTSTPHGHHVVADVDGLLTGDPRVSLMIYVADCAPVWLADRRSGAIGLLHSGRKGTEGRILTVALVRMCEAFGTRPKDVIAVLGPCIRPPDYEVDIPAGIAAEAAAAGVGEFVDCGENTAQNLERFYSYRAERGRTGRMLAMIARDALP